MSKKRAFRRWAWRSLGLAVVAGGVLLGVARSGRLTERGYELLYGVVAGPGRLFGAGELSGSLFYAANCGANRNPRRWMDLVYERKRPGIAEAVFTCREPVTRISRILQK